MSGLEKKNRKRVRRENLQKIILGIVASAGILAIGLVTPNVIKAMAELGIIPKRRQKEYVSSSASKLVEKDWLKFNGKYYELTAAGEKRLRQFKLAEYKLPKQKRWDRKWRIIIYDIPEKRKGVIRKQIFNVFNQAGFYRLQNSVWVYPYDCEDLIGLLKTDFGVGKEVLYIIADEIESDRQLRSHFELH